MKKKFLFLLVPLFFVACDWPGDPVEETSSNKVVDFYIPKVDGDGSKKSPYKILKNAFYKTKDKKTYYSFKFNDDKNCKTLIFSSDFEVKNIGYYKVSNLQKNYEKNSYSYFYFLVDNLSNGFYDLEIDSSKVSKFGVYSPCFSNEYDIFEDISIQTKNYEFKDFQKLYTFTLDSIKNVAILDESNIKGLYLFDSDFKLVDFSLGETGNVLTKGKYYLFIKGSNDTNISKFKFEILKN